MLFLSQFYSETGLQPETDRYPLVDKGGNLLKLKVKARKIKTGRYDLSVCS